MSLLQLHWHRKKKSNEEQTRNFTGLNTEQFALCHEQSCQILFFLQLYCQKELSIFHLSNDGFKAAVFDFSLCWWLEQPLRHRLHPSLSELIQHKFQMLISPTLGCASRQPLPGSEFSLKM